MGGFNINLLKYDAHTPPCDFVSLLLSQNFLPYIIHPTRVSDHSSTIIDNIFSNVCNLDTKSGNILTQVADHFPQFLIVRKAVFGNKTQSFYQHDYSKFDQDKFIADFVYPDDNQSNASAKFSRFLGNVDEIVKKHAPLKKLTKNDLKLRNKPWINSRIQKMMHLRDS